MSRIQLALNVEDLDEAVTFYTTLFGTEPAKRRPGYANFAVEQPPLKLVLFEAKGRGGTLNHLGVEVETPGDVQAANDRLAAAGLAPVADNGTCCYALQEKVWVGEEGNGRWEVYAVLADAPAADATAAACCS